MMALPKLGKERLAPSLVPSLPPSLPPSSSFPVAGASYDWLLHQSRGKGGNSGDEQHLP